MPSHPEPEGPPQAALFGTFQGVFRPTALTIMGALLYLREGWLVGTVGLGGALAIILGAYLISGTTALSLSSLATNTRVKPGGAFAIIAQALGLEAGGAIGIPLFIAQSCSSAMYLYAFSEAWGYLFPTHDLTTVVWIAFAGVSLIAWLSAGLAFRAQAVMAGVVVLALLSALGGTFTHEVQRPAFFVASGGQNLRDAFGIFFPACTGIMVGVGMSGQLQDPRSNIPRGTMMAWGTTLGAYLLFAFWYAVMASPQELVANKLVIVERALLGELVLVGLAVSTLMAALSSLVAAPRLLQAMAQQGVVPGRDLLSKLNSKGEPAHAALATTAVAAVALTSGSLDAIAPIITTFFIVTYLAVNVVVLLEYRLSMVSFRPTFDVGYRVPLIGVVVCVLGLALATPSGGLLELIMVVLIYFWLGQRRLQTPWETVRSGVDVTIAAWAAHRAADLDRSARAWKPDMMVLASSSDELRSLQPVLEGFAHGHGSVKLVGIGVEEDLQDTLATVGRALREAQVYTTWTHLTATKDYARGATLSLQALQGAFFPPNMVLMDGDVHTQKQIQDVIDNGTERGLGLIVALGLSPDAQQGDAAVWLSDRSPAWELRLHNANLDLPVLLAYLMTRSSGGKLRLVTVVREGETRPDAARFLEQLVDNGRLPDSTARIVVEGDFLTAVSNAPEVGIHFFGIPRKVDLKRLKEIQAACGGPALFTLDSGRESLLA